MRIKLLIAGLLGVASTTAFAQKGELNDAKSSYETYTILNKAAATYAKADQSLLLAKASIDKASTNAKTSALPQTYALKAAIYATFALRGMDTAKAKKILLFNTADEALKKAKELDAAGENKALIADAATNLSQIQLNNGVNEFKAGHFDLAYKDFDYYHQLFPKDTTALYYSGLAAVAAKDYKAATVAYEQLLPLDFSRKPTVYLDLSTVYLSLKDTVSSLKRASEGVEKYPLNSDLRRREIEISLQTGKAQEVLGKIQTAISNDPKNKALYYYAGLTYTSFGDGTGTELSKLKKTSKDAAAISALQAKKDDFYKKSAEMYNKALELDPSYFEANLNLGYSYLAPAIDLYNAANALPANKQKEYDATIAKAIVQFNLAKPYLLKATELNPKSIEAYSNLRNYYMGTRDMTNANATQKKIDELKAARKQGIAK